MTKLTDTDKMKFGKFNGIKMANVPDSYLLWFWEQNKEKFLNGGNLRTEVSELMEYIQDNLEDLKS